jgi:hypothetical protein
MNIFLAFDAKKKQRKRMALKKKRMRRTEWKKRKEKNTERIDNSWRGWTKKNDDDESETRKNCERVVSKQI